MRLSDLWAYLFAGDRGAIERLAQSRASLPVGALLVLTASVARNHDGAWLLGEPQALAHGLVVSTGNAFLLYSLFFAMATLKRMARPRFWLGYTQFLALFWLTSPMAWLYAIPYEHMTQPEGAVDLNAWTLAFVSVWRVLIMARVMAVLWGSKLRVTVWPVLLFSDVVLLIGAFTMPTPIVDFMGGLQHANPVDSAIFGLSLMVKVLGTMSLPVWLAAAVVAITFFAGGWTLPRPIYPAAARWWPSMGVLAMLACVAAVMGLLLHAFQPAQARRFEATLLLREDFGAGLAFMSRFERADFPPIWDPPPRLGYGETAPSIEAIRGGLAGGEGATWVRAIFLGKSWNVAMTAARSRRWDINADPRQQLDDLNVGHVQLDLFSPEEWASVLGGLQFHVDHDERLQPSHRDEIRKWLEEVAVRARERAARNGVSSAPTPAPPTPSSPPPPPP